MPPCEGTVADPPHPPREPDAKGRSSNPTDYTLSHRLHSAFNTRALPLIVEISPLRSMTNGQNVTPVFNIWA